MARKNIYITTPIYYPNAKLHLGHAYTTVLADVLKRYKKLKGYNAFLITGSDEHGEKLYKAAKNKDIETKKYIDEMIITFKELWKELDIDFDIFVRTTDKIHEDFVKKIFIELYEKNYIYKDKYVGFYCQTDETFFTKTQLLNGGLCPECNQKTIEVNEDSYFLKVSFFEEWIKKQLEEGKILEPEFRRKELLNNFIYSGLKDLSITRSSFNWGINVPFDDNKVIYVWFDALLNYLSAFKYNKMELNQNDFWAKESKNEIIQFVGKEITRFHAIYWPIILKMLNLKTPRVISHGWILSKDSEKMSKSKGNVIDPIELIKKYTNDTIRFYLINEIDSRSDGVYNEDLILNTFNSILVNKYSNSISRVFAMLIKYNNGIIPKYDSIKTSKEVADNIDEYHLNMDKLKFNSATKNIIEILNFINVTIDNKQPWNINDKDERNLVLIELIDVLFKVNLLLQPIIPNATNNFFKQLNIPTPISFEGINKNLSNIKLDKYKPLFLRIK